MGKKKKRKIKNKLRGWWGKNERKKKKRKKRGRGDYLRQRRGREKIKWEKNVFWKLRKK